MFDWQEYKQWSGIHNNTLIPLPAAFVRMLHGDVAAAYMLRQIIYWHEDDKFGNTRLQVRKKNPETGKIELWLVKSNQMWDDEIGLSQSRARRCIQVLVDRGLIEVYTWRYNGSNTNHISLNKEAFCSQLYQSIEEHKTFLRAINEAKDLSLAGEELSAKEKAAFVAML